MIEKRFNYHIDEVGTYYYICDNTKKDDDRIILEVSTKYDAIEVCNVLNELNDENEQLKKQVESKERLIKAYDQWAYDLKNDGVLDECKDWELERR